MIVVGLTGSIGMGKSTTANMFRALGVAVHDSDAAVHSLYNGPKAEKIEAIFPGVLVDGKVDRKLLSQRVLGNPAALSQLEDIVHPLVAEDRDDFLAKARASSEPLVVLDIPLLFEIGGTGMVDSILVVSAPASVQRSRVLARPGMNVERFESIMAKQFPDSDKRRRAHFLIDTGLGFEAANHQVKAFLKAAGFRKLIKRD